MPSAILDVITHYQRSIEKSSHDEVRLLYCIEKLYKLPVTVEHLQSTGVGKTVNSLRKYNGEVGIAAKTLVAKWKAMVAAEEKDVQSDEEIGKAPYDDDRENGNSSNKNSTIEKMGESSSLLENRHNSNISNHSSSSHHHKSHNSNNLEGQNYVMKRKHDSNDDLNKKDEYRNSSGSSNKHHKKMKKECDTNESSYSRDSTSYEKKSRNRSDLNGNGDKSLNTDNYETQEMLSDIKPHIKQEKLESLEDDDQSGTGYEDEGEKLVIDVKHKIEEDSDDNADDVEKEITEKRKDHNSLKSMESSKRKSNDHKNNSRSSSRHSRKESSSSKSKKESNDRHNSDKLKSASHHHQKSKHYNEKKSKDKDDESNNSSSSHHRSKSEKESRHKDRGKGTENKIYKEKDKNKSKTDNSRSSSKSHRHHDSNILSSSSDEKHTRKISHNTDSNSPSKPKVKKPLDEGIDSSMGTSFEEALGMLNTPSSSFSSTASKSSSKTKTKSTPPSDGDVIQDNFIKPSSRNSSSSDNKSNTPELLTSSTKLVPLDLNINLDLPTISPNYKPMPLNPTVMDCVFNNRQFQRKILSDEEAIAAGISSKTMRTKVYSGVKTGQLQQVPTLFDLCIWVLQKNIDALEYTGGVPYDVLKPVLELATPIQLANFEEYNPYLMEDTDYLWEKICTRHCKGVKRQEMESWREMYMRCQEEREERLSKLTENIKQSQKQITLPLKKTQLAYMDSMVKPPRSVLRKQEQFGTSHKKVTTPAARVASLSGLAPNIAKASDHKVRIIPGERDMAQANAHTRPKKAPLMQKTLQLMKDDDEFIPSQRLKITKSEYSLRNGIKEGIDIIPDCNKQLRNNEKRRLWERRCLGLGLLENNLS